MAESWTLKLDGAEKHLKELEDRIDAIDVHSGLHRVDGPEKAKGYKDVWVFRLHVTHDPDPELAVIVGDVLHNARAALDHIAVALVPRKRRYSASFPIAMADPWNDTGTYACVHDDPRERFEGAVRGAPEDSVAAIKEAQPSAVARVVQRLDPQPVLHPRAEQQMGEGEDDAAGLRLLEAPLVDPALAAATLAVGESPSPSGNAMCSALRAPGPLWPRLPPSSSSQMAARRGG